MERIREIHTKKNQTYGSRKMTAEIHRSGTVINHKRVERLIQAAGIRSKVETKFKATTNSRHKLPVTENLLNREFVANKPNQKMVSDITYLWTDEGWLYIAGVMDLCGQKVIGLSMSERMTKEIVTSALTSAWLHAGRPRDVLIRSGSG